MKKSAKWILLLALLVLLTACGQGGTGDVPSDAPSVSPSAQESEPPAATDDPEPAVSVDPVESDDPEPAVSDDPVETEEPTEEPEPFEPPEGSYTQEVELDVDVAFIEDEVVALSAAPAAVPANLTPEHSGTREKRSSKAVIDYSNVADGYVMACFTQDTNKKLKVQVKGPSTTYTYSVEPKEWATFPLSDGNGTYKVGVYQNVEGTKYSTVVSASFEVGLTDQFAPFERPNQYVNYAAAPNTVAKAAELVAGLSDPLAKVEKVYDYVVGNMSYDDKLAASVKSGYLPDLDAVLASKKGICFDYAAMMAGMLRSQGVPCKLVVGYAGKVYHAWINVWSEKDGWVDGAIYFDGKTWKRMDPTFASNGNRSESIMKYIGNGSNYAAKYFY